MTVPLIHLSEVDSTQSFLARHPELGPCAVMADLQTAGRGRGGNRWESARGAGLWMSVRIPVPQVLPGLLLQKAMGAVVSILRTNGVVLGLKWPNDLVALKAGRLVKVGGIIGESAGGMVVLGLGLNLGFAPSLPERSIPPACLAELSPSQVPDPEILALEILKGWEDLESSQEPFFRWPSRGEVIRWETGQGTCMGWEADGRLRVETDHGIELLSSGDVTGIRS